MSQNVGLKVSGLYTAPSDLDGLPPGALDVANNVESRYKNLLEPRRGFNELPNSAEVAKNFIRLTNFYVDGLSKILGLDNLGNYVYYNNINPWPAVPGNYATNINPPDPILAKSRFVSGGQNMYLTAADGVRSLSSGASSQVLRAGVPKGLNIQGATNGDSSGFLNNNTVLSTTGTVGSGSPVITDLGSTTGLAIGMYAGGTDIPAGTTIIGLSTPTLIVTQTGDTNIGSNAITTLSSISGLVAGTLIVGSGIPDGTIVLSATGGTVTMSNAALTSVSGNTISFFTGVQVTLSQDATGSASGITLTFYTGSQVGYRIVFGRTESNINTVPNTRLGAASSLVVVTNVLPHSTNVIVTVTLPKNSVGEITFLQLYRSNQTASTAISPLDQYNLVYERALVAGDFTARTVTVTDTVPDSLVGIPLYSGSDQEGILQSNFAPPMCWDMATFRDFALYGNITRPSTLTVTLLSAGSPSGVQTGDAITISGSFAGTSFSESYTASGGENAPARIFEVFTGGTPSQNITDTANSLIRVVNYDNACPVHAILLSSETSLPGQILFEYDNPSVDTFTVNASAHQTAYDPTLSSLVSSINTINNGIGVSKTGEIEAVPITNILYAGDSSSPILRIIALRNYAIVLKGDGIYKVIGNSPQALICDPFDLTTKPIGPDTAVSLNSGVWFLSNQGVVSVSDAGVDARSTPIDDQIQHLIESSLANLTQNSFAIGYESDRKYILNVPTNDTDNFCSKQFNFNYVTSTWTTWSRNFYSGFIHSLQDIIYVSKADLTEKGVSFERATGSYQDYVDEAFAVTITAVSGNVITLTSVDGIKSGDVLFKTAILFSPITSIDINAFTVTVLYPLGFVSGAAEVLQSYLCTMTWKQVFGDNPAFVRQFPEGVVLFKNTAFDVASMSFQTDYSQGSNAVPISGYGNGLWGLFPWGEIPWGGANYPSSVRFYVPASSQYGSYIIPTFNIQQGMAFFQIQGLALQYVNMSPEVGL